ncbi:AraC family transcriptional regulator [Loktanella sp. IMCC34160]|uniref:AraC family transcriptional regulator n=1 Tax=Loktanella sp. IMCC34160 TaxID=2510646 RepID=UPI00101DDEC5|nr:helix-turn-helix transcriptional regulator [Loktanella sp. IMCC34160]RYG90883.1 AraC family transcriptional regulator [Loktanella sp. IMCC34160]
MTIQLLKTQDIFGPSARYHLARAELGKGRPRHLHGHDFHELLWVQNGVVRHHLPDGREDLTEGALVFAGPLHRHGLEGRAEATLVVSLSLHPEVIADIGRRHPDVSGQFFWSDAPTPIRAHLDSRQLADLNHAALRLERAQARSALELETFLLPLLARLLDEVRALPPDLPLWLAQACAAVQDPAVFRDGAAGLVARTGKVHAHVSRTMRRLLNLSPSEYVNRLRMEFAARRLAGSTDPLPEIATDCGIPNMSHFHKLFRDHHGLTPAGYRRRFQRDLIQP